MRPNTEVYPEIAPYRTHEIPVDAPHVLYAEECGNPDGLPAVFLHGGPGGGAKPFQRRSFDPTRFRAVLFDQRGCGRSRPSAVLDGNTTDRLIADIETVRTRLGIDRWVVAGGSWGSYLALSYAIAHPDRVLGLRLHGIFLGSRREVAHWYHGIGRYFPEAFADFAAHVPEAERGDLLAAYHRRLIDPDPAVHEPAAMALRGFSARTQTIVPNPAHIATLTAPTAALEISRIFAHYCANGFFQPEGHILGQIDRIRHIPAEIVQGRYDVVTPPETAFALATAWPEASMTWVALANHVATPDVPDLNLALADATDRLADRIAPAHPSLNRLLEQVADSTAAISHDGAVLAWVSDETGVGQIWTRALPDGVPGQRLVTEEKIGTLVFRPKSRDLLFTTDAGGDERHQIWVLPDGADRAEALVHDPRHVHAWGTFDAAGARIAWSDNARDPSVMDVWTMEIASGVRRCLCAGAGWQVPMSFRPDGSALLIQDNTAGMHNAGLTLIDPTSGAARVLLAPGPGQIGAARWSKDGATLYLATNRGAEFAGIAALDVDTGGLRWLVEPDGDVEQMALSPDGMRIAFAVNRRGWTDLHLLDIGSGAVTALDGPPPGRTVSLAFDPDGASLVLCQIRFEGASALWRVPLETGMPAPLIARPEVPGTVTPVEVMIEADDGVPVPAFVFEGPEAVPGRPALVWVHGGPESQFAAHWRPDLQFLVNRGWTVVAPNVRGSTGYGRAWQSADDRETRMRAVADLKAVRDWTAARDGVDADRLAVGGQSYGGFMTLSALTEYPGDWAAGVDLFGFADFIREMETTAHYRRVLRAVEYGDWRDPADRVWLKAYSPVHKLDVVEVPLFVAHGLEDPRVPPSESEAVVTILRSAGNPPEMVRIPGEGHGFQRRVNRKRVYGAMTAFLMRHLGIGPAGV